MTGKEKVAYWLEYCLNNQHCSDCDSCCYGGRSSMICDSLIKEAIQELSKGQEPKKVLTIREIDIVPFQREKRGVCPTCNKILTYSEHTAFCGDCGQAVKWE